MCFLCNGHFYYNKLNSLKLEHAGGIPFELSRFRIIEFNFQVQLKIVSACLLHNLLSGDHWCKKIHPFHGDVRIIERIFSEKHSLSLFSTISNMRNLSKSVLLLYFTMLVKNDMV